jgi:hypothetical protein
MLAAVAVLAALMLTACGNARTERSGEEGHYIDVGDDVLYQVQLTRLLDPNQRPDDTLLEGQPKPPSDEQYLAVFLIIENKSDEAYSPPSDIKVVDTQDNEYEALDADESGFALELEQPIPAGDHAPPPDSPAQSGPDRASMLLYRISQESALDNLPLELEIPANGSGEPSRVDLDL